MAKHFEVTPKEAAQRLGVGLSHAYQLIWAGRLRARRDDGRWLIPISAIEERLARTRTGQAQNTRRGGAVAGERERLT